MSACCRCTVHYGSLYVDADRLHVASVPLNAEGAAGCSSLTSICICVHLHPLLACNSVTYVFSQVRAAAAAVAAMAAGGCSSIGGRAASMEVGEVAEHAHSPRCRVSHFTVRWARTPRTPPRSEEHTQIDSQRRRVYADARCPEDADRWSDSVSRLRPP